MVDAQNKSGAQAENERRAISIIITIALRTARAPLLFCASTIIYFFDIMFKCHIID
jgi:hypothetical protein